MSNYAEIVNNIVVNVIVADQEFIATQTDKNYVLCTDGGIGWTYNGTTFIAPQPYPSWVLDSNNVWQPPVPQPPAPPHTYWNEETQSWLPFEQP